MANYARVFRGIVLSKEQVTDWGKYKVIEQGEKNDVFKGSNGIFAAYKLKIVKTYKGTKTIDTITVLTPFTGAACGYRMEVGGQYALFCSDYDFAFYSLNHKTISLDSSVVWTNHCTANREWFDALDSQLVEAGKGR